MKQLFSISSYLAVKEVWRNRGRFLLVIPGDCTDHTAGLVHCCIGRRSWQWQPRIHFKAGWTFDCLPSQIGFIDPGQPDRFGYADGSDGMWMGWRMLEHWEQPAPP